MSFNSISKDFGNDFVGEVTEANWSVVINSGGIFALTDKSNEAGVESFEDMTSSKEVLGGFNHSKFVGVPEVFVEGRWEAIRAGAFVIGK